MRTADKQHTITNFSNFYADTERVIRTIKEDLVWTKEFDSMAAFETALSQWRQAYNEQYPHSSLGYMTPYQCERWFKTASVA